MIKLHITYCDEHCANHWLDEHDRCYGESSKVPGYNYVRHIGGGWYEYRPALIVPLPFDWQMAIEEHVHVHDLELDF